MDDISRNIDEQLLAAYLATSYEVEKLGIRLRIGEKNRQLEEFMVDNNIFCWAFISAYNPFSKPLSLVENEKRHAELLKGVAEEKLVNIEGVGIPDAVGDWEAEKSLLILDITRNAAVKLAKRFEQNAFLVGRLGGKVELVIL